MQEEDRAKELAIKSARYHALRVKLDCEAGLEGNGHGLFSFHVISLVVWIFQ
jgi:hypothetical protein